MYVRTVIMTILYVSSHTSLALLLFMHDVHVI